MIIRRLKHGILLCILLAGMAANTVAQEPIIVNVVLMPPYPNYADELIQLGDEAIITIQNTDFSNSYEIKLGVQMDGSNGINIRTKDDALPSQAILLNPGETQILTGSELSSFYNNYNESNFEFTGITIQEVINDQSLPDGVYTVCVRAYDFQTNIPLSAPNPQGCAAPFAVVAIDPPIITYPVNNMVLQPQDPQLFNINWLPVTIAIPDLRYRLEMIELDEELINPYDAFDVPDFLFLFEDNIAFNSFLYGMEYPLLEIGTQYAIRVRAYREDGLLNVLNQGYSDIVIFRYGDAPEGEPGDDSDDMINQYTSGLPGQDMTCGSGCNFNVQTNAQASANAFQSGSTLLIGNFELYISTVSGSGTTFSGTGIIQPTDYLPVGIKVNFSGMRATANGRVIAGKAEATIRENSWIDHTWSDIEEYGNGINTGKGQQAWDNATDPDFYLENLSSAYQQIGTSLPISIGSGLHRIQVVGMHFFPERAAYNLAYIQKLDDDAFGERYLSFLAKDLCISPGGPAVGADEARLELVKPVRYHFDNVTSLTFAPATGLNSGTFLAFDCDGFSGIEARGTARFDPSVFKSVDEDGTQQPDTVMAHFHTSFVEWSDWVAYLDFVNIPGEQAAAGVDMNRFVYTELDDYILKVEQAFFDHSIARNPEGMAFPANFNGTTSNDWQGAYIKDIEVELPTWVESFQSPDKKTRVSGHDLIIDSDGLTGIIAAENVLLPEDGSLGSWYFSITDMELAIVQNSLNGAMFAGTLKIPVIDEPFNYQANIEFFEGATLHTFNLNPTGEYTFPVWFADATIAENSNISIVAAQNQVTVAATLHGDISFAPVIGDIDKNNLTGITFNNMVVRNRRAPEYITFGNIGTNLSAQTLAIAGFGVILESLAWEEANLQNAGLILGLGLDLGGSLASIRGSTELFLKTKIENHVDSVSFVRDGTAITGIKLNVETGAVNIKGEVNYFKDNSNFGSGFDGNLEVSFLESIKLDGNVLFGNKMISGEKVNYWYAFAMAWLPTSPVPFATPVDIYAFGGGVFYNMAVNQEMPDPQAIGGTTVNPREAFVVSKGTAGLQASVVLALTPSSRTFNADVTLTAVFDIENLGLNSINFTGAGYVMQKIDEPDKENAMMAITVSIGYDKPIETLTAKMKLTANVPKSMPLLSIGGEDISFLRSPDIWYFKAGIPANPLQTTLDLGVAGIKAGAYFMTGQSLPPPVLPARLQRLLPEFESNLANGMANDLGIGFLAGVHLDIKSDLTFLGTGLIIHGMAGVDLSLMHWYAALCNGNENFGVNKWYAMGQCYVYGFFGFTLLTANVLSVELGVVLQGGFPNPTGVSGTAVAKVETFFGLIEYDESVDFSLGSQCNMTPIDMEDLIASGVIERPETELESIDMIGQITPSNHSTFISTTVKPTVQWKVKQDERRYYSYGDGFGGLIHKEFKFSVGAVWSMETENGGWTRVDYRSTYNKDTYTRTFAPVNAAGDPALINGSTRYKIRAVAEIKEKKNGNWEDALHLEGPKQGQPIRQVKEHIFTTATNLTEIDPLYVDYTLPYDRQRYYPYDHLDRGHFKFNVDHEAKFQDFETCGFEIFAEFKPVGGSIWERITITRENLLKIRYDMANFAPSTTYEMRVIAERSISPQELADETNVNCRLPDASIFENLGSIAEIPDLSGGNTANMGNVFASNYAGFQDIGSVLGIESQDEQEILQTKVLHTLYFRTSMYATPDEKLQNITVANVDIQAQQLLIWPNFLTLRRAYIGLNCGEGFDKYDVLGHDYQAQAGLTNKYFEASGPNCENTLSGPAANWYTDVCTNLYQFGSGGGSYNAPQGNGMGAQSLALKASILKDVLKLPEVFFRPDPSNYSGIKHIMPLLNDAEVGLAAPTAIDPATVISFLGQNSGSGGGGSGSGSSGAYSGWNSGAGQSSGGTFSLVGSNIQAGSVGGFAGTAILGNNAGNYKLELVFDADRKAYDARQILLETPFLFPGLVGTTHTPLPNGTYPIQLQTSDFTDEENPINIGAPKTIQVNLQ